MNIVLFGAGGYGQTYLNIINSINEKSHRLCAIVDPFADEKDFGVPVFKDEKEFFKSKVKVNLAIISSPIYCHFKQTKDCLEKGINVLCEKPVCADLNSAVELEKTAEKNGVLLGVGFQLSWCEDILRLKNDIKNGLFGKPILFKCLLSWQRPLSYYQNSTWKGRIRDNNGNLINDSVIFNATSHYLHNIFFTSSSALKNYDYITARANDIESFDTCIIKGTLENEAEFWYGATHCGEEYIEPVFEFQFENATVYYNQNKEDKLYAVLKSGEIIDYGALQGDEITAQKLLKMLCAKTKEDVKCGITDSLPHLKLCTEITAGKTPVELKNKEVKNGIVTVPDLCKKLRIWYENAHFPQKIEL